MEYRNGGVRRQDRLLDEGRAREILLGGEYGFLAMASPEGGYGIPVNYVVGGGDTVYIHCAPEGRKLRAIASDCRVSFCVVGKTCPVPEKFTTAYESIVIEGRARVVVSDDERRRALELLVEKYSPDYASVGAAYIEKSFHRTAVIAIDAERWSGKTKKVQ